MTDAHGADSAATAGPAGSSDTTKAAAATTSTGSTAVGSIPAGSTAALGSGRASVDADVEVDVDIDLDLDADADAPADATAGRVEPAWVTPFTALSASVLLTLGDRILVANRRGQDWFYLLGGSLEPGENVETAVRRLIRHAAGLTVRSLDFVGVVDNPYRDAHGRAWNQTNIVFAAEVPRFAEIGSRVDDLELVTLALRDLSTVEFRPAGLPTVISRWLARRWPDWYGPRATGPDAATAGPDRPGLT